MANLTYNMMQKNIPILISFSLVIFCGRENTKESNDSAPPSKKSQLDKECNDKGGTIENGQCKLPQPTGQSAEQQCTDRGADFSWINRNCIKVPNVKLIGELPSTPCLRLSLTPFCRRFPQFNIKARVRLTPSLCRAPFSLWVVPND